MINQLITVKKNKKNIHLGTSTKVALGFYGLNETVLNVSESFVMSVKKHQLGPKLRRWTSTSKTIQIHIAFYYI